MDRRAVLVIALLSVACAKRVSFENPLSDDGTFPNAAPTSEEARRFRVAADYSAAHGGLSVLVIRGERAIFEEQQNGNQEHAPHHLFSGTKSFSCALAVALADEGALKLDRPVAEVLEEWRADPRKSRITPRHLLHFVSGLEDARWQLTLDGLREDQRVEDKYAVALALPAAHEPGAHYQYAAVHLMVFGALVQRLTGRDPVELLGEKVLGPIGLRYAGWSRDPAGNPALPYGAWTTAREWAKFGVLLRDGGAWKGRRVLSPERVAECFQGSEPMPGYGLALWLNRPVSAEKLDLADSPVAAADGAGGGLFYSAGPADLAVGAGYSDQRLYVIPSRNLVIVRLGSGDRRWSDAAFLARALDGVER